MLIGKLFVVPFTKRLIAAIDEDDASAVARDYVTFVSDLYKCDLVSFKGRICLAKPYLGEKNVKCSKGVIKAWQAST